MTEYIKNSLIKLCDNPEWFNDMLNTWDFKPERESQEINKNHLHSEFIRLRIREILQINLSDIALIDIIPLP